MSSDKSQAYFGIGELARRAGIAPSAIRYYEQIGLLPPAPRLGGKRQYNEQALRSLMLIRLAQKAGYSTVEIHTLLHRLPHNTPPPDRWRTLATAKMQQIQTQMERLRVMQATLEYTLRCSCVTLEECAENSR